MSGDGAVDGGVDRGVEAAEGVDRSAVGAMVASVALLAAAGAAWIWRRARRRPDPPV